VATLCNLWRKRSSTEELHLHPATILIGRPVWFAVALKAMEEPEPSAECDGLHCCLVVLAVLEGPMFGLSLFVSE
jgi:hypothetical protein